MGEIAVSIKEKLLTSFNPSQLDVIDESSQHSGHAGAKAHADEHGTKPGGGESHFHVRIASDKFKGMSRIDKHRAVMEVLSDEMKLIHAFRLDATASDS